MEPIVWILLLAMACIPSGEAGEDSEKTVECELTAFPPTPTSACCGYSTVDKDYVASGTQTERGKHPWLVAFGSFFQSSNFLIGTGGNLISGRYVLTSASLLEYKYAYRRPVSVVLGGAPFDNFSGFDCIAKADGTEYCGPGVVKILIESITYHPKYQLWNAYAVNNIALVRLKEKAKFDEYTRPICLPFADINDIKTNVTLYAAGWREDTADPYSRTYYPKSANLSLSNTQFCRDFMKVPVNSLHVCAEERGTCASDLGSLMRQQGNQYELVGLRSFWAGDCKGKMATVYTNVFQYRDWIEQNIKP